jgi:hypothetical protein
MITKGTTVEKIAHNEKMAKKQDKSDENIEKCQRENLLTCKK